MKNILFLLALLASMFANPLKSIAQTPSDKQLQAIEKHMAPQRKKVTDILEADKTSQYKTYKADLEILAKESDLNARNELIAKLSAITMLSSNNRTTKPSSTTRRCGGK